MNNKKNNVFIGGIFIVLGLFLLFGKLEILNVGTAVSQFWPALFIILPGLLFHAGFFKGGRIQPGLLVPGGILLFLGICFQISVSLKAWEIMWPGFIMAVAVGLFELYYFGNREPGLLIPVGILGGLSVIFFATISFESVMPYELRRLIVPIVLIGLGLAIVSGGVKKSRN